MIRAVLELLVFLLIIGGIIGLIWRIQNNKTRELEQRQGELARYAPSALAGEPLVSVVIDQGRELADINDILNDALAHETFGVLTTEDRERIRQWQANHRDKYRRDSKM